MKRDDLKKLAELADVLLDHRLALLRQTADAKLHSERALEGLATEEKAQPQDMVGASAALASLAYARWADARRAEINLVLARQTHEWLDARESARNAFGRAEALRKLKNRAG